jgi:hypothetical protein
MYIALTGKILTVSIFMFAIRAHTRRYKFSRYIARRNKGNRTLKQNCKNKSIIEEHEYGNSEDFTC